MYNKKIMNDLEKYLKEYDDRFSPQIGNDDECGGCKINFKELREFIEKIIKKSVKI